MVEFSGEPPRLGGYTLLRVLGQGGQGVVHLAEDASGSKVAVKVLHAHLAGDERAQRSFVNEVRAIGRIAEFCTTRVLDVGVVHGRPYIVSEYVDAESLQDAVQRDGPRGEAALHRLAVGTAAALAAIHNARVVHRDFKPHNVLLAADGPRVIDFGIARALEAMSTTTTGRIGTLAYMAPEQISGAVTEAASDVFAWAGTMVYAATGRPPFGHEHPGAVMHAILTRAPDLDGVPMAFHGLLGRCLDKDPEARPAAKELVGCLLDEGLSRADDELDLGRLLHDAVNLARSLSPRTRPDAVAEADDPPVPADGRRRPGRRAVLAGLAGTAGLAALSTAVPWFWGRRADSRVARSGTQLGGTILVSDSGEVRHVSLLPASGGMVLFTFHSDGVGRLWEPVTGTRVRELGRDAGVGWVESGGVNLFIGAAGGASMALVSGGGAAPVLWDVTSGDRLSTPFVDEENWDLEAWRDGGTLIGLAPFDGHLTAYFTEPADAPGPVTVLARDVTSGETVQEPWKVEGSGHVWVEPVDLAGRGVLLVHSDSGGESLQVWDALSRSPMGRPVRTDGALKNVLAPVAGRPILLASYADGTIRRWDVTSGTEMDPPMTGHENAVLALWAGSLARRPAVVSGSADDGVRVWDPRTGRAWGEPLTGHSGQVNSVAGGTVAGRAVVVSGSADGTIRQWGVEQHST
ncbi:serine/threonine-protein kinase [Actinomadura sp. 7K507]|uniref:serine/threonine-protein kinase n=1 Tax=Actinomadura sp. 7K507 TaxID=2530365 RepID=UPI00104AC5F4|nr:serine/threonine-protein kinase [Actinomadura sp. 7K507]TDC94596.1 hypothetical protein E1285_08235 [Actinomadura sp. 7K507]